MNRLLVAFSLALAALVCTLPALAAEIQSVTYENMPAYRISDGKTEAVVVPQIGRIMRYGRVGGKNVLWNASSRNWKPGDWKNYGGEKNWLSPQSSWAEFHGADEWPPDPAFDGSLYSAKIIAPGVLEMHSHVSRGTGVSLSLALSFDAAGDLVLRLSGSKTSGPRVRAGLWSNAQVVPGEAIFLPISAGSAYKQGFLTLMEHAAPLRVWPDMVRIDPDVKNGCKIGVDSDVSSIVSVAGSLAFLDATQKLPGAYPDGPETAGLPVELYVGSDPANFYCELELLGPLVHAKAETPWAMTLHWSLHDVPQGASREQVADMARRLLYGPQAAASSSRH